MRIDIGDNLAWILFMVALIGGGTFFNTCNRESPSDKLATKNMCILHLRELKTAKDTLNYLENHTDCQPYALPDSVKK
jgi:hypothetical protein